MRWRHWTGDKHGDGQGFLLLKVSHCLGGHVEHRREEKQTNKREVVKSRKEAGEEGSAM